MGNPLALAMTDFGGMIPRVAETLLPDNAAYHAANCSLLSGALQGLHQLLPVEDLRQSPIYQESAVPRSVFAVGNDYRDFVWKPFASPDVCFVKGALVNDAYDRYYWTGDGVPKYNTRERIKKAEVDFILGVPAPANAPTVAPHNPNGTGSDRHTRAYVYTFVSPYGEEGNPSDPVIATGEEGDWVISGMSTTMPDLGLRAGSGVGWTKRIYRTVPGATTALFYFVDEIPLAQASYTDSKASDMVVFNSVLESLGWEPPPVKLEGIVAHPNGFLVGFVGSDIYMSVPYRPHAWPSEYILSTEYPIVALGVYGRSIVVATTAKPYVLSGVSPMTMTFTKVEDTAPCLSKHGMVNYEFGVVYPSDVGLVLVTGDGVKPLTEQLIRSDQWRREYKPKEIFTAVRYGTQYIAFNANDRGFVFNPAERAAWSMLDAFEYVDRLVLNPLTGRVYVMIRGVLWEWDSEIMPPVMYRWRSKVFDLNKPMNLGAARVNFTDAPEYDTDESEDVTEELIKAFNEWRFQFPLAPIGQKMFGSVRVFPHDAVPFTQSFLDEHPVFAEHHIRHELLPQNSDPAAGSALWSLRRPPVAPDLDSDSGISHFPSIGVGLTTRSAHFRVWADDNLVLDTIVYRDQLIMMPPGFKARHWQFEVQSFTKILKLEVATSPNALERS